MTLRRWLAPVFLICLVLAILIPLSPRYRPVPSDDPSVYLYVGQRVLDGGVPYRDAWDHKQPLAFLLYALGLLISQHSLWGMWLIELAGLLALALMGLWLAEKLAPRLVAVLAVSAGLLALVVLIWGYSLEELSLALQMITLAAFARLLTAPSEHSRWGYSLAIGVLTGVCFFLKQSLIAAGLTAGLVLVLRAMSRREWRSLISLAIMVGGAAAAGAGVLVYLLANHVMADYRDAAITFNLLYANLGPLERAKALLDALRYMVTVPGLLLGLALWVPAAWVTFRQAGPLLARWLRARRFALLMMGAGGLLVALSLAGDLTGGEPGLGLVQWLIILGGAALLLVGLADAQARVREPLAGWLAKAPLFAPDDLRAAFFPVGTLYFPITLVLLTLSGRTYVYYFIPLIPALMLLCALTGGLLARARIPGAIKIGALVVITAWLVFQPAWMVIGQYRAGPNPVPDVIAYIQSNTRADQTIMAWGKDTTYTYFMTDRKAPSRYFYQAAISLDAYNARSRASDQVLRDMQANPPALFLIPGGSVDAGCSLPASDIPNSTGRVYSFVCQNYTYVAVMDGLRVYRLK